jgi:hypothetical protein
MGANKTYQQKADRGSMLGESDEFRRLRHAVGKAAGDRRHPQCLPSAHREPIQCSVGPGTRVRRARNVRFRTDYGFCCTTAI